MTERASRTKQSTNGAAGRGHVLDSEPTWQPKERYKYKYLQPPAPRQRGRNRWRWLRRIAVLGAIGLVLAFAGVVVLQQRVASTVALADVRQDHPSGRLLTQPSTILLLGVDLRPDQPQDGIRSDTVMLLRLDPGGGWGSLVSIPRDSVALIPGFDQTKINAAFSYGYANAEALYGTGTDAAAAGAALAANTVESFLGLPDQDMRIDYVATINFDGFASMIDALGGIMVDVPGQIIDSNYPTEDFGIQTIRFEPGLQSMNGERALQYVRTRYADSDFGRGERQQQVIQAMINAIKTQPLLLRPISALRLADAAGNAIRTTLPVGRPDALLMGLLAARIDTDQLETYQISPETVRVQERGSDLIWNRNDVVALVKQATQPPGTTGAATASPTPSPLVESATIQIHNGAGVPGVASQASERLRTAGLDIAAPDNTAAVTYSQLIDYGRHPQAREQITELFGSLPIVERAPSEAPDNVDIVVVLGADYRDYLRN